MKEIFEQYGGLIITVVAILAVITVVRAVIGSSADGYMGQAFTSLIHTFLNQAETGITGEVLDNSREVMEQIPGGFVWR